MKEKNHKKLYWIGSISAISLAAGVYFAHPTHKTKEQKFPDSDLGLYLAGQHAQYVQDFDTMAEISKKLSDNKLTAVRQLVAQGFFISGDVDNAIKHADFKSDVDSFTTLIINTTALAREKKYDKIYSEYKNNGLFFLAPMQIWSAVATNRVDAALKIIENADQSQAWRDFNTGLVYAYTGKIKQADAAFARVPVDTLNLNDYFYLMSFYKKNKLDKSADKLFESFAKKTAGLYLADIPADTYNYSFDSIEKMISFSTIYAISHYPQMNQSSLSLLLLRMAESLDPNYIPTYYYLGLYFYDSDIKNMFDKTIAKIPNNDVFYPFAVLKQAEMYFRDGKNNRGEEILEDLLKQQPLFYPAISAIVTQNISDIKYDSAERYVNTSLKNKNLSNPARAFLLKIRAHVYAIQNEFDKSERDLNEALMFLPGDAGILNDQMLIWAYQGKNLDEAYKMQITLIKQFPGQIAFWDTLGCILFARGDVDAAQIVFEKVAGTNPESSALFEHLGDIYLKINRNDLAKTAYSRAIELSYDGQINKKYVSRKLKRLK